MGGWTRPAGHAAQGGVGRAGAWVGAGSAHAALGGAGRAHPGCMMLRSSSHVSSAGSSKPFQRTLYWKRLVRGSRRRARSTSTSNCPGGSTTGAGASGSSSGASHESRSGSWFMLQYHSSGTWSGVRCGTLRHLSHASHCTHVTSSAMVRRLLSLPGYPSLSTPPQPVSAPGAICGLLKQSSRRDLARPVASCSGRCSATAWRCSWRPGAVPVWPRRRKRGCAPTALAQRGAPASRDGRAAKAPVRESDGLESMFTSASTAPMTPLHESRSGFDSLEPAAAAS